MKNKAIAFHGSSKEDLGRFPLEARRKAAYQLQKVQSGLDPSDWKPIANVGHGAIEIRIQGKGRAYRIIYVAKFADAIHVLHAFQKTTRKTSQHDIELARSRYDKIGG